MKGSYYLAQEVLRHINGDSNIIGNVQDPGKQAIISGIFGLSGIHFIATVAFYKTYTLTDENQTKKQVNGASTVTLWCLYTNVPSLLKPHL